MKSEFIIKLRKKLISPETRAYGLSNTEHSNLLNQILCYLWKVKEEEENLEGLSRERIRNSEEIWTK